jgi:hypothetical protein
MKKYFLVALLLASSAFADSPEQIAADYRKQATQAVSRLNQSLEKAATPLITKLVSSGDTDGAALLTAQLKDKLTGEPVPAPHGSAVLLFAQYDQARTKSLKPVQKSSIVRIDSMLKAAGGPKLETVTELGKVRAEIEAGKMVATSTFPSAWTYHKTAESVVMGDLTLAPEGTWKLVDVTSGQITTGTWKQTSSTTADLNTGALIWKLDYQGKSGVIARPDIGNRYIKLVHK